MSEKYSKIFSLPENLYAHGSPVVIKAGALLKDNESNRLIGQLKLHSISNKKIKLVKIELTCLDSLGRQLDSPIVSEYLDLIVNRGVDFGAKTPINIANLSTRSYTVKVIEVGFDDNTVWFDNSNVWEPIPKQAPITSILKNHNEVQGYKVIFGTGANMAVSEYNDLWLCTCGEINHSYETRCNKCNSSFADLKNIDVSVLATESIYSTACNMAKSDDIETLQDAIKEFNKVKDYKDSSNLVEQCLDKISKLHVANENKNIKRTKLISFVAGGLVLLILLGYFAIYPLVSYANGIYGIYLKMYGITSFNVPEGEDVIADYAFSLSNPLAFENPRYGINNTWMYGCKKLESVTIPEGVTHIGNYAFMDCTSLTNISIPNSVISIGDNAFYGCEKLTSITIPSSVTSVGDNAFYRCESLTKINIPSSVTSIGDNAFYGCESLTKINIPDSVTSIGDNAFSECNSLTSIEIPYSVTSIGTGAFSYCNSLESITLARNPRIIGLGIPSVSSIILKNGISVIYEHEFAFNGTLTSITIPSSVKHIESSAFAYCTSLTNLRFEGTVEQWNAISLGAWWNDNVPATEIICSDGTVSLK